MKSRLPQGMGGGAQNRNDIIRQAQKMQEEITAVQESIDSREFTASVGGGQVEVVLTGKRELKSLTIKPEVVDPQDIEMLQDLIISAVNQGIKNIEETSEKEMGAVTGGISFPGLF